MTEAPPLVHLHHITAIASDARRTVDFYTRTLGLRLVKQTVDGDDPTAYHLAFACDGQGTPGTILSLYVWPQAPRGRWGVGTAHHLALLCEDAEAQDRWKRWLMDQGVPVTGPYDRTYFRSIYFTDPDGLILEIATAGPGFAVDEDPESLGSELVLPRAEVTIGHRDEEAIARTMWPDPVERIDEGMRLRRLHHVTCIADDDQATDRFYRELLGLRRVKVTVNYDNPEASHLYYADNEAEPGSTITFFGFAPDSMRPGRVGVGTVHHIAYACPDDEAQLAWRRRLRRHGMHVTPIVDRTYFRSISFRDPAGVTLEIATEGPGFHADEPPDALGTSLSLPDALEDRREEIEAELEPLDTQP